MSKLRILFPALAFLAFTGCFQILHLLTLNEDGTTDVKWRFAMSKPMAEKSKGGGPGEGKDKESIEEKIAKSDKEIREKFQGAVTNLRTAKIDTEFEVGIEMEFRVKDPNKVAGKAELDEGFPLVPRVSANAKQLVFFFKPDEDKKKKEKAKQDKEKQKKPGKADGAGGSGTETDPASDENMEQSFEEIGNMIMSSARYQLFLGGKYEPVSAVVKGKSSKKTQNIAIMKIGNLYLIDFPFMSVHQKENDGYELIVTLK